LGLVTNKISIAFFYPVRYTVSNRAAQGRIAIWGPSRDSVPAFLFSPKKELFYDFETTIRYKTTNSQSKLRIMDPISASSPLAGVKLDREAMCAIDNCIKDNFIYS